MATHKKDNKFAVSKSIYIPKSGLNGSSESMADHLIIWDEEVENRSHKTKNGMLLEKST